jgi:hypothetical protein
MRFSEYGPKADRELVRRGGLYAFARLAWHVVEPSTPFRANWHLRALASVLEDVTYRRRTRVVINVPPSTGKSVFSGVFWPAWEWIAMPERRWMFLSFDSQLLHRDTEKLLELLRSRWFVERWGARVSRPAPGVSYFLNDARGFRFNTSIDGKATGWHAHTQVIDDPVKAKEAFAGSGAKLDHAKAQLSGTFGSRSTDPATFARVLIMQRIGEGDPTDWALSLGWEHVCFPMSFDPETADPLDERTEAGELLFPSRFPAETIEKMRREVTLADGYDAWETQYEQKPAPIGGQILKPEWLDVVPEAPSEGYTIQSWDLTFRGEEASDFVAGQWWRLCWIDNDPHFFHLSTSPVFERATFLETLGLVRDRRHAWPCDRVVVEDKANGPALESLLGSHVPGGIELYNPGTASKAARVHSTSGKWALGRVHLVAGPYVDRWMKSFPAFPKVRRDDEIDAATQAIRYLDSGSLFSLAMSKL